ncbi:MAG: hypothetical protein AAFR51_02495 [Pseudomonadota bacterium]
MYFSLFACAGLGLLFAHSLRLPFSGSRLPAILAFFGGLIVSAICIKMAAGAADIGRTTDFDRYVKAAVLSAEQDPAPIIAFSGASYSRNGIDPERLTLALRERGYPHRVVNLSIEAASILERDTHLSQFMTSANRVPDIVFVEVAQDFDDRAAYMFGNSKFNARAIEQYDLTGTAWTSFGILGGACQGAKGCVLDAGYLAAHSLLNFFNVGLIGSGETLASVGAVPAYDPQYEPRVESRPEEALARTPQDPVNGPQWVRSYRSLQRQRLLDQGVREVAYYQPPALSSETRAYADALCRGELAERVCISPDRPDLMQALNDDHWFDPSHLLDSGTAIYNAWLVEQIIASGVLESVP